MRLLYADIVGALPGAGLAVGATTVTFAAPLTYAHGVPVPTLGAGDTIRLTILTPTGRLGEVVDVTAYNSGTGAATLVRAREGTAALAHWPGAGVTSAVYPSDVANVVTIPGLVNVKAMGAAGDGVTDDTAAIHAALALNRGIYLPKGTYLVTDLTDTGPHPVVGDGSNTTVIKAKAGTGTLYTCVSQAGKLIRDVYFNGNAIAATCVNTDWNLGGAPSQGNRYSNIRVSGYTTQGWFAKSNNDSVFDNCLIEAVSGAKALKLNASGGLVELNECRIIGPFELVCQAASIVGGFFMGVRIISADWNMLQVNGGYWYADPVTHNNIDITGAGAVMSSSSFNAVHMENAYADGAIIGGTGAIYNGVKFNAGHLFTTGAGLNLAVLVKSTVIASGPKPRVTPELTFMTNLVQTVPSVITYAPVNCVVDGLFRESRLGVVSPDGNNETYLESNGLRHYSSGTSQTSLTRKSLATVNSGATATFANMPRSGLLHVRNNSANGGSVLVYYSRVGSSAGTVTVLGSQVGAGGESITVTIPAGNAQSSYLTDISVSHSAGSAQILHVHAFGF